MQNRKMRDVIDERNERERISKSIVKSWNVNYVPAPPKVDEAAEILERLEAEAAADEAAKRAEIEALLEEARNRESSYNKTTGSYSGSYGAEEIGDEVTRGQIDKILHEKTDAIRSLIEHAGEE